jgi:hypothetical protein
MSSNGVNVVWLDTNTVDLSDEEFSAAVHGVVRMRQIRNAATMETRQLAIATGGVSLRPEYGPKSFAQQSAERKQYLLNSYIRSGCTYAEADRRIRELT